MDAEKRTNLREKAAAAWKRERPLREAARVEKLARQIEAAEAKLAEMFGPGCEIKMGLNPAGTVRAEVEDLRFLADYYEDDFFCSLSIILMETCPSCGRELMLGGVDNLADVGKKLEEFEQGHRLQCLAS